jgi:hypothetical protein
MKPRIRSNKVRNEINEKAKISFSKKKLSKISSFSLLNSGSPSNSMIGGIKEGAMLPKNVNLSFNNSFNTAIKAQESSDRDTKIKEI